MDINTDEGNAPSDNRTVEKSTISKQADSETVHSCSSHQLGTLCLRQPRQVGTTIHIPAGWDVTSGPPENGFFPVTGT